MLIGTQLNK